MAIELFPASFMLTIDLYWFETYQIFTWIFSAFTYLITGCNTQGYHGDTSTTYFVGEVDQEARNLVKVRFPG